MTKLRGTRIAHFYVINLLLLANGLCLFGINRLHAVSNNDDEIHFISAPTVLFSANFENNAGDNNWNLLGGASNGNWVRGIPKPYTTNGIQMEIAAFEGSRDLLTGNRTGEDVDGGPTSVRSGNINIPTGTFTISFQYYFAHSSNSSSADYFRIELRRASDNALLQTLVNEVGTSSNKPASWTSFTADISSLAGETINFFIATADLGSDSDVEAAIDDVLVISQYFENTISYTGCSGDGYSVLVNGTVYNEANPRDTIQLSSQGGSDSIIYINLIYNPKVIVEAGMKLEPLCSEETLDLTSIGASISGGTTTGMWTTTGDGYFNNNGKYGGFNPATIYTLGSIEIVKGKVILSLTSDDPLGPCDPVADAIMILINDLSCSQFPWVGN